MENGGSVRGIDRRQSGRRRIDLVSRQYETEQLIPFMQIRDLLFGRREAQLCGLIGDGIVPQAINDVLESSLDGARLQSVFAKQADDLSALSVDPDQVLD